MSWLVDNWYVIIAVIAVLMASGFAIVKFTGLPTKTQIAKVKEWLLYAVTMAESEFGGGTGTIKLRYVYDLFVGKFPWLAKMISFEMFSGLVDEALVDMKKMLQTNEAAKLLIKKDMER